MDPARKTSCGDGEALDTFWTEVRGSKGSRRLSDSGAPVLKSIAPLITWAVAEESSRPALCVVPGDPNDRANILRQFTLNEWRKFQAGYVIDDQLNASWLKSGLLSDFASRISTISIPKESYYLLHEGHNPPPNSWELLWALVWVEDFVVEEPLRGIVDQSFYLMHHLYKAIWEARFLLREHADRKIANAFLQTLVRWLTGANLTQGDVTILDSVGITRRVESDLEKLDMLCCLLTFASQNALLSRTLFVFDGLENALSAEHKIRLRELHLLIVSATRWTNIGRCPLGVILGFRGTTSDFSRLKKLHPKLAQEVGANFCGGPS